MIYKLELRRDLGLVTDTEDGCVTLGVSSGWNRTLEDAARLVVADALRSSPNHEFSSADPRTINFGPEFHFGRPIAVRTASRSVVVADAFAVPDGPRQLLEHGARWNPPALLSNDHPHRSAR